MDDGWSDERIKRLKKLWADGLSAGDIMVKFAREGATFTRSAVIGKITRLKLPARNPALLNPQQRRAGVRVGASVPSIAPQRPKPAVSAPSKSIPAPERRTEPRIRNVTRIAAVANNQDPGLDLSLIEPAIGTGLKLFELENHTCRWPFGDPLSEDFYFCGAVGANLLKSRPYCAFHMRKAENKHAIRNVKAFDRSAEHAARRAR